MGMRWLDPRLGTGPIFVWFQAKTLFISFAFAATKGLFHAEHNQYKIELALINDTVRDRFHGVPVENKAFVDRPGIMEKVRTALGGGKSTSGCKIVALCGLGGMGKTQL